ncbi:RNA-guided pseudouridylation complex pseudouridine synthase subunit Cbf5 [Candidatus Woesearchaeota archaeon]|nr:RNA-guided pseudouridylation complex pseudouridine synthase subunit Cbf5 [Candidatus Woesearchaeota archaeon]
MTMLPFEKIKREVLVRKPAKTSSAHGVDPFNRPVEQLINYGVVNIDKPKGPTSHQVSDYTKKILGLKKAGHSGTLDPNVTGVLAIALGDATRVVQLLLTAGKEYVCLMHLHKPVQEAKIRSVFDEFTGNILQLPPIKSAVKRQWRNRKVYYSKIIDVIEQDVLFKVGTQAGTYIRKLVHDMGQKLGVGAHMAELRRTKAGPFNEDTIVTLQDLSDAYHYYKTENNEKLIRKIVQPVEAAIEHIPKVWVLDSTVDTLCHGASLKAPGISKVETEIAIDEEVAVLTLKGELVGYGIAKMTSKELQTSERGIAVKVSKVFMKPGTYPKIEK